MSIISEYLEKGKISYYKNIKKEGNISKDVFQIDYEDKTFFLVCTFRGHVVIHQMLIS